MEQNLHGKIAAAAHSLAQTGRIGKSSQRKLSQIFTMVFGPDSPQPRRRGPKRTRSEVDKIYRFSNARKVYVKALRRGACYFLAFVLCVTATDCRDTQTALFPEQDERASEIQFSLHKDTLALFRSWARFNGYDTNSRFISFVEQLRESPAEDEAIVTERHMETELTTNRQPVMDDFDIVTGIIRIKGLERNSTVHEAMSILFPERVYRNWPLTFGLAPMGETRYSAQ